MSAVAGNVVEIEKFINDTIAQRDQARNIACALESELAQTNDRIREALGYLADALIWTNDPNTADCVSEAITALRGEL